MSQSPITVTYSLEEILGRIEGKIDDLKKDVNSNIDGLRKDVNSNIDGLRKDLGDLKSDVNDLRVGQTRLEAELVGTKTELKTEMAGLKTELKTEMAGLKTELKTEMAGLKTEIAGVKEDIKEIKGSQKAQIWTLIGILGTAVVGTVIRFVITALPGNP